MTYYNFRYLASRNCNLQLIGEVFGERSYGFIMAHNETIRTEGLFHTLNNRITELHEIGEMLMSCNR